MKERRGGGGGDKHMRIKGKEGVQVRGKKEVKRVWKSHSE